MKRTLLILTSVFWCLLVSGQNSLGSSDDAARIAISPYLSPDLHFNAEVAKQLTNKMNAILTKQGLAGSKNQRFIITANACVLSEDIVVTTQEMYQYQLEVSFIVGDGIEGTKFAMASQEVKGLGETKAAAYLDALKKVKPSDPKFATMVTEAKTKIIEYFNSQCDFIIADAKSLADKNDYDAAISKLMSVPEVCKECYEKCLAEVKPIYQAKIDNENAPLLSEAQNIWNAGQDRDAAIEAGAVLSKINPASSSFAGAMKLSDEISKKIVDIQNEERMKEQREWELKVQQHNDQVALEKASIKAMRDVEVAYAQNQPKVVYNTQVINRWLY